MDGIRDFSFAASLGTLALEDTDFWIEHTGARRNDGQIELGVILHNVWEHVDFDTYDEGLEQRSAIEDRVEELANWTGQKGTLTLDGGAKVITGITLDSYTLIRGEHNQLLEYDLNFTFPLDGFGSAAEISRTFEFAGSGVKTSYNLIVEKTREDKTLFKEVFRAAPVRIPSGDNVKEIKLTAIRLATAGGTALAKRQAGESAINAWTNMVGTEGTLKVDGTTIGTAHLKSVTPVQIDLPDTVAFELLFYTDYSS